MSAKVPRAAMRATGLLTSGHTKLWESIVEVVSALLSRPPRGRLIREAHSLQLRFRSNRLDHSQYDYYSTAFSSSPSSMLLRFYYFAGVRFSVEPDLLDGNYATMWQPLTEDECAPRGATKFKGPFIFVWRPIKQAIQEIKKKLRNISISSLAYFGLYWPQELIETTLNHIGSAVIVEGWISPPFNQLIRVRYYSRCGPCAQITAVILDKYKEI